MYITVLSKSLEIRISTNFLAFRGFLALFDEVSLQTKVRRYFGKFSGRLLS